MFNIRSSSLKMYSTTAICTIHIYSLNKEVSSIPKIYRWEGLFIQS